jgi:hypothetical protein
MNQVGFARGFTRPASNSRVSQTEFGMRTTGAGLKAGKHFSIIP